MHLGIDIETHVNTVASWTEILALSYTQVIKALSGKALVAWRSTHRGTSCLTSLCRYFTHPAPSCTVHYDLPRLSAVMRWQLQLIAVHWPRVEIRKTMDKRFCEYLIHRTVQLKLRLLLQSHVNLPFEMYSNIALWTLCYSINNNNKKNRQIENN